MANLTIAIEDDILKKARLKAVEDGTSVNAVLREFLASTPARIRAAGVGEGSSRWRTTAPPRSGRSPGRATTSTTARLR